MRGPGKRFPFLKRLKKEGLSALGLGPTAELQDIYITCDEDQILREKIFSLHKNRANLGVIITGPATSGKTRVAMELISNTWSSLVFIWPGTLESRSWSNIPKWKGPAIIVADNVVLSQKKGEIPLSANLQEFLVQCQNTILIGTIRKSLLPEEHKMLEIVELRKIGQEKLWNFAVALAKIETKKTNENVDAENIISRYNGYPASLVAGLDAMRETYRGLTLESRSMLQASRTLWEMGIRTLTTERVWEVTDLLNGIDIVKSCQNDIINVLLNHGFISFRKNEPQSIEIYEGYLDQVIDLPNDYAKIEKDVISLWCSRGDATAFIERGNSLSNTRSFKYQTNPQDALQLGISAYEEALRFRTPERAPLDYAGTQNNLGLTLVAHGRISKGNKREMYINKARDAFVRVEKYLPGRGSYNLACISALCLNEKECVVWLEKSKKSNNLPPCKNIEQDSDLDFVRNSPWFIQFLRELKSED